MNPWRRLNIYQDDTIKMYKGKARQDAPPHLYALCDEAYRNLIETETNQTLLIT
jgi:myosin heavy subunit